MNHRHAARTYLWYFARRYPWTRRFSPITTALAFLWLYFIHSRERVIARDHIKACAWDSWEPWYAHATPHRSVFIADPQLVDSHTYPGRPWPFSSLTEFYTDLYMRRNFRLINQILDPDSVVFLGDLFDGGREWSTQRARNLDTKQRQVLINLLILPQNKKEGQRLLGDGITDLNKFVPGEKGRWSKWKQRQWDRELGRFARIFLNEAQLYPGLNRTLLPAWKHYVSPVSIANGAKNANLNEYAIAGSKSRTLKTSLPGNHDVGFGSGVQVTVRDRFESHFGDASTVYVLGNHTFVSLDTPSLSAYDEYVADGGEVSEERRVKYSHIWKPTNDFLNSLDKRAPQTVQGELERIFPGLRPSRLYEHTATEHQDHRGVLEKLNPAPGPFTKRSDDEWKLVSDAKRPTGPWFPVVLLSHVPLFRNPDVDCGKWRERGTSIPLSLGYQYQNVLTPTLSSLVAKKVSAAGNIVHIFSGDDHDYCDVTHRFNIGRYNEKTKKESAVMRSVREITVKSFSWAMGVRKPAFLLVSMWNPVDWEGKHTGECMAGADSGCKTIATELCFLPDQLSLFINYAQLLGLTVVMLLIRALVIGIRSAPEPEEDESDMDLNTVREKMGLPRYFPRGKLLGQNGSISPTKASPTSDKKGVRGRSSPPSTGAAHGLGSRNQNLSFQRSCNVRTRTVSPTATGDATPNQPGYALPSLYDAVGRMKGAALIERAGHYPSMHWRDPDEDGASDEESRMGSVYEDYLHEGHVKGSKFGRKRGKSKARKVFYEFSKSVLIVGIPAVLCYVHLIRND